MTDECACGCGRPVQRWWLSEPCGYALAGMCLGKPRLSQQQAVSFVKRSGGTAAAYRCVLCARWHNGKAASVREGLDRERARIVRDVRRAGKGWVLGRLAEDFAGMDRVKWKTEREHRMAR